MIVELTDAKACCGNAMKQIEKAKKCLMKAGVEATPGSLRCIMESIENLDNFYRSLYYEQIRINTFDDNDDKPWM